MDILAPKHFTDYELLDCGNYEKLERFGEYITIRPEPQALWAPALEPKEWDYRAHVRFVPRTSSNGEWKRLKKMPDRWEIACRVGTRAKGSLLKFRLALTSFKHVGIFPEQAVNWEKIYTVMSSWQRPKFLNLFAYTGGASLAARAAGADVTHVDSIRQVVNWANENMQLSELDNIRWLIDDAMKFVKKEVRRGNTYNGIILDPPAYGHGPGGEKWKLEEHISEMMENVLSLVDKERHLLILNAYSLGYSALVPENLLRKFAADNDSTLKAGELYLPTANDMKLPLGVWGELYRG